MTTSPTVTQTSRTFRIECAAAIDIRATPQRIWSLLTNATDFPRWNSTVTRITGTIAEGERLALEVAAAPGRTFRPRVIRLEPARLMVWSDGFAPMFKGVRTYTLTPKADGTTTFHMVEVFTGLMLPMIAGSLPDFGPVFEQYAADLERAATRS